MLKYFSSKEVSGPKLLDIVLPSWVSKENASYRAWLYVQELKIKKMQYIKSHYLAADFQNSGSYQIRGAEIAKDLGISRSSLMNTSKYSIDFRNHLDGINLELAQEKDKKVAKIGASRSRGTIRSSKGDLVLINNELKKRLSDLENKKVADLVTYAFDQLPLDVKRKMGL
ncbi:hypothetical protein [Zhongshania marina]|uniref:Uncharacterized protein n=1 Tax=Zhongshania marina TaxID=2304603 RepID=A0A2S4HE72_9GAMM|nr:hypothetical protein [Marortus luteolus]POP52293.1 hypothetical protein C0068_13025 [Marortus luteolus]